MCNAETKLNLDHHAVCSLCSDGLEAQTPVCEVWPVLPQCQVSVWVHQCGHRCRARRGASKTYARTTSCQNLLTFNARSLERKEERERIAFPSNRQVSIDVTSRSWIRASTVPRYSFSYSSSFAITLLARFLFHATCFACRDAQLRSTCVVARSLAPTGLYLQVCTVSVYLLWWTKNTVPQP